MDSILAKLLETILAAATPELIKGLQTAVNDAVIQAKNTPNPFDDVFFGFLQTLIGKPQG